MKIFLNFQTLPLRAEVKTYCVEDIVLALFKTWNIVYLPYFEV